MAMLPTRRGESGVSRWDPVRDLETVRREMDRLLDDALGRAPAAGDAWAPLVDVEETDDAWVVEADLPGVRREDVEVELQGDELTVRGEVRERERTGILRRRTRRTGQFDYRVRLPGDVHEEGVEARLDGGVLTVRVPKAAAARRRRIEITG